jgi:methionine-rich copper-binding protein CopC
MLFIALPTVARAHALLVESTPKQDEVVKEAPGEVVLRFNARIEKGVSRVTLIGPGDDKVKLPPLPEDKDGPPDRLRIDLPALKPGAYKLEFRVLASDGHATPGLLRFTVSPPARGAAGGPPEGGGK